MSGDAPGVTDLHVQVQPWRQLTPAALKTMRRGHEDRFDRLLAMMEEPKLLLEAMDRAGIARAGLVNYPCPDVLGFTDESNAFSARYAESAPARLLPFGGVHPRFAGDIKGHVDELVGMGIRCLTIHPPHQLFPANAYTQGLLTLGTLYRRCQERGLPVMVHTGTSDFPGARCKYGRPMELDDVAIDFPELPIIMAHGGRPLWMDEAFFIVRRHPNVWLELSGIPPTRVLEDFPRLAEIADRVLWGTGWPGPGTCDMKATLEEFRNLDVPEDVKTKITTDNAWRLFPSSARSVQ